MLSITLTTGVDKYWHIGEKSPIAYKEINSISEIQADGDELEHIKDMFSQTTNIFNMPISVNIPKGRVVRLFGDFAKTIVANLTN